MCGAIPTPAAVCGQWWRIQRLCDYAVYTREGWGIMGLYIFKSKHAPYMKVGFTSWDNPWNRVNGSADIPYGFSSVTCLRV